MTVDTDPGSEDAVVPQTPTDEQAKRDELNARCKAFVQEYGELVAKHKVDFATYPMFVPDGNGGFKIVCQNTPVDMTNQPIRSDFMSK